MFVAREVITDLSMGAVASNNILDNDIINENRREIFDEAPTLLFNVVDNFESVMISCWPYGTIHCKSEPYHDELIIDIQFSDKTGLMHVMRIFSVRNHVQCSLPKLNRRVRYILRSARMHHSVN